VHLQPQACRWCVQVNGEQADRYVRPQACDYVVDLGRPTGDGSGLELEPWHSELQQCGDGSSAGEAGPQCAANGSAAASWVLVFSTPFLDAARTPLVARVVWLPAWLSARLGPRLWPLAHHLPYQVFRRVGGAQPSSSARAPGQSRATRAGGTEAAQ